MKKIITASLLFFPLFLFARDQAVKALQAESGKIIRKDPADMSTKKWKNGGFHSINISQGSLSNRAAGSDNFSLSTNSLLSLFATICLSLATEL